MSAQFADREVQCARTLVHLALEEDLGECDQFTPRADLTTRSMIDPAAVGTLRIVSRQAGVVCGTPIVPLVLDALGEPVQWLAHLADADRAEPGDGLATLTGNVAALLTAERTILNFLTALGGVATLTQKFVAAVKGTGCEILDTRKTWPGWRALQKYAVRCGGGSNHRIGLFDAVLIKDNHLAARADQQLDSLASAVEHARRTTADGTFIEVEVDTLQQLADVLPASPDAVLLDNFSTSDLREAVRLRDDSAPAVKLEASGGITLETASAIAATGIDRISIGALTHSAPAMDIGFDWQ